MFVTAFIALGAGGTLQVARGVYLKKITPAAHPNFVLRDSPSAFVKRPGSFPVGRFQFGA